MIVFAIQHSADNSQHMKQCARINLVIRDIVHNKFIYICQQTGNSAPCVSILAIPN